MFKKENDKFKQTNLSIYSFFNIYIKMLIYIINGKWLGRRTAGEAEDGWMDA